MQEITVYHNPQCSNSRGALALLKEAGYTPRIVTYLDCPVDEKTLHDLIARSGLEAADFVRFKEADAKAQALSPDQDAATLIAAVAQTPRLMQRPIVDFGSVVVIARPPDTLMSHLSALSEKEGPK